MRPLLNEQPQLHFVPSAHKKGLDPDGFIFSGLIEHMIVLLLLTI